MLQLRRDRGIEPGREQALLLRGLLFAAPVELQKALRERLALELVHKCEPVLSGQHAAILRDRRR